MNKWQPIDTAPKDDSRILLTKIVGHIDHPSSIWWVTAGSWSLKWKKWWDGIEPCGLVPPTHWMPIPRLLAEEEAVPDEALAAYERGSEGKGDRDAK